MGTDPGRDQDLERFFRCALCKLPHEANTTVCPITGRPIVPPTGKKERKKASNPAPPVPFGPSRAQTSSTLGPGFLLDRKYLLGEQLGQGGMGVVYEATHVLLARKVAVKLIRTTGATDLAAESRFLQEGRNLASVAHPHVVNVFDFGVAAGVQYLVMEYLEGESLETRIDREGALDLATAFTIARQVLRGLAAAHAHGIVHRDLKPANVFLLRSEGDRPHVKLIDFGISTDAAEAGRDARVTGTPGYMSPEQARGDRVDVRSDLYSFGATMYEALTARPPILAPGLGSFLHAIQNEVPPPASRFRLDLRKDVDGWLHRLLAKDPGDRYSTAEEVLAECVRLRPEGPRRERYVLVADAGPSHGEVCRRVARSLGRDVVVVRDGVEALDVVRERGAPDLLIATTSLPRMDGLTLLSEARKTPGAEAMTAVIASRFASIRAATWDAKEALGIAEVLAGLDDEGAVRGAMEAALQGKTGVGSVRGSEPRPRGPESRSGEIRRLDRIGMLRLARSAPPDVALQRFVAEVAEAFKVPIAVVALGFEEKRWFRSYVGLSGDVIAQAGIPEEWAFCSEVAEAGERVVVPDAKHHPVFKDNPLVRSGMIGGFAGAPLVTSGGEVLGALCIVDDRRLALGAEMLDALDALARRIAGDLELSADELTVESQRAVSSGIPSLPASSDNPWSAETLPPIHAVPFGAGSELDITRPVSPDHVRADDLRATFDASMPPPGIGRTARGDVPIAAGLAGSGGAAGPGGLPSLAPSSLPELDLYGPDSSSPPSLRALEADLTNPAAAVFWLDADRRVVNASPGVRGLFGVSPEAVIGLLRDDLVRVLSSSFADSPRYLREVHVLPKGPFAAQATLHLGSPPRAVRWYAKPTRTARGIEHVEVYRAVEG